MSTFSRSFLCLLVAGCSALRQHFDLDVGGPPSAMWIGSYGPCSVGCGVGTQTPTFTCVWSNQSEPKLVSTKGMSRRNQIAVNRSAPAELCGPLPKAPMIAKACEASDTCTWRIGTPPEDRCGWAQIVCGPSDGVFYIDIPSDTLRQPQKYCEREEHRIGSKLDFRARHGLVNEGCPKTSLQSFCTVTINQPGAETPFASSEKRTNRAHTKAAAAMNGCGDADIIVFATQEMTNVYADIFPAFSPARNLVTAIYAESNYIYSEVGRCGGSISAGVVVIVKAHLRKYFAESMGKCQFESSLHGEKGAWTNSKGTAMLELFTVLGTFVAASTHGHRGGVYHEPRVLQVRDAVHQIIALEPAIVAWGGDFNTRTPMDDLAPEYMNLLMLGTTHPPKYQSAGLKPVIDQKMDWAESFDPLAAYQMLAAIPDVLGGHDGKSMQDVLTEESGGQLTEVPAIRSLCPTYRKAFGTSQQYLVSNRDPSDQYKDKYLLPDGTIKAKKNYLKKPTGAKSVRLWVPTFACQAEPGGKVDYFLSPLDKSTTWPDRSPSWTERIIVKASAGTRCEPPRKVPQTDDHDVLYAVCSLQQMNMSKPEA